MKFTNRDKDEAAISRLKRIKHEPLSPPSIHSEDEQSSLSDESDDDELTSQTEGHTQANIRNDDDDDDHEDHIIEQSDETSTTNGSMTMKKEFPGGATRDLSNNGDQATTCEINRRRAGHHNRQDQIAEVGSSEARLTSLTPPLDTLPAIHDTDQLIAHPTRLSPDSTTYPNRYTQNTRDHNHRHNHHHSPGQRRPSISRDRCDEVKLSEQQQEHLALIFRAIKEGNFDKFSELLGKRRDTIKKLLNVFVDGQTALHYSLMFGRDSAWCRQLVMNGANPNQTNRAGWHPIHLAAYSCSPETMLYLIDCYAEW